MLFEWGARLVVVHVQRVWRRYLVRRGGGTGIEPNVGRGVVDITVGWRLRRDYWKAASVVAVELQRVWRGHAVRRWLSLESENTALGLTALQPDLHRTHGSVKRLRHNQRMWQHAWKGRHTPAIRHYDIYHGPSFERRSVNRYPYKPHRYELDELIDFSGNLDDILSTNGGRRARISALEFLAAAIALQSFARMVLAVRRVGQRRYRFYWVCAQKMQGTWRIKVARRAIAKMLLEHRQACELKEKVDVEVNVVMIQAHIRGRNVRRWYNKQRRHRAAMRIQRVGRGFFHRVRVVYIRVDNDRELRAKLREAKKGLAEETQRENKNMLVKREVERQAAIRRSIQAKNERAEALLAAKADAVARARSTQDSLSLKEDSLMKDLNSRSKKPPSQWSRETRQLLFEEPKELTSRYDDHMLGLQLMQGQGPPASPGTTTLPLLTPAELEHEHDFGEGEGVDSSDDASKATRESTPPRPVTPVLLRAFNASAPAALLVSFAPETPAGNGSVGNNSTMSQGGDEGFLFQSSLPMMGASGSARSDASATKRRRASSRGSVRSAGSNASASRDRQILPPASPLARTTTSGGGGRRRRRVTEGADTSRKVPAKGTRESGGGGGGGDVHSVHLYEPQGDERLRQRAPQEAGGGPGDQLASAASELGDEDEEGYWNGGSIVQGGSTSWPAIMSPLRDAETGEIIEKDERVWCDPPPTPPEVRQARREAAAQKAAKEAAREEAAHIQALAKELEMERERLARERKLDPHEQAALRLEEQTRGMEFIRKAKGPDGRPALMNNKVKDRVLNLAALRDRYQAQLLTMLEAEDQREVERRAELARYTEDPNKFSREARNWIKRRHAGERREARASIDRIRHGKSPSRRAAEQPMRCDEAAALATSRALTTPTAPPPHHPIRQRDGARCHDGQIWLHTVGGKSGACCALNRWPCVDPALDVEGPGLRRCRRRQSSVCS